MSERGDRPLVGLPTCVRPIDGMPYHVVGEKYLTAAVGCAGVMPIILPSLGRPEDIPELLDRLDGIVITGSPSNVEPHHYGGHPSRPGTAHDPARDASTLPLIRSALGAGVPALFICRGLQELNVALGGTLHQRVHEVAGLTDHRADPRAPEAVRYGPAHDVTLVREGLLARLFSEAGLISTRTEEAPRIRVNSVHTQGIDRLAPGLVVEARAPDGLIEAVRVADAAGFAVGVQWHPEYGGATNPYSRALFEAFGHAVRHRAAGRGSAGSAKEASHVA